MSLTEDNLTPSPAKKSLSIEDLRAELEKNLAALRNNRDALSAEIKRSEAILKTINKQVKI